MTIEEIERLLRRLEHTDIAAIEVADETTNLRLRFASGSDARPRPAAPEPPAAPRTVKATAIGLLRLRHPQAAPISDAPFPRAVVAGEIVAFLEAGPCLRPVVAEYDGMIGPPLVQEGRLIGYGTDLFLVL